MPVDFTIRYCCHCFIFYQCPLIINQSTTTFFTRRNHDYWSLFNAPILAFIFHNKLPTQYTISGVRSTANYRVPSQSVSTHLCCQSLPFFRAVWPQVLFNRSVYSLTCTFVWTHISRGFTGIPAVNFKERLRQCIKVRDSGIDFLLPWMLQHFVPLAEGVWDVDERHRGIQNKQFHCSGSVLGQVRVQNDMDIWYYYCRTGSCCCQYTILPLRSLATMLLFQLRSSNQPAFWSFFAVMYCLTLLFSVDIEE